MALWISSNQRSERSKFGYLLLTAFISGLFLAGVPDHWLAITSHPQISEFVSHILRGLGDAMMIASIIAVTVDETAKRKLLKEFGENISTHVIGRLLPPELREHIHHYLNVDFVRYNWEITYTISLLSKHPHYVQLHTRSSYEIENRSPFPREYVIGYEVEEPCCGCKDVGVTHIKLAKARDLKPGHERDLFELHYGDPLLKTRSEEGFIKLCLDKDKNIMMPGHDPGAQQRFKVEIESIEFYTDSFYTPFDTFHPVLQTTLSVLYPSEALEIDLSLTFDSVKDAAQPETLAEGKKWTITRPMLPGQGFVVRWSPRAKDDPRKHRQQGSQQK